MLALELDRELAGALTSRAMLYLGHNQPVEAWQDLLACHRLGRLIGSGGVLVDALVGIAIEQLACRGDIAFLDRMKSDAAVIEESFTQPEGPSAGSGAGGPT